jgi:transcriptional regulator with GAF, ATPase, and Fis domain
MKLDENDFFRRATLLICSSLDIETVLRRCMKYLGKFMPVSGMFLNRFEPELGIIRCLAMVSSNGDNRKLPPTALNRETLRFVESRLLDWGQFKIVNEPRLNPVARVLFKEFDISDLSFIVTILTLEGQDMGALGIMARGERQFTESDGQLISLLKEPFTIAMSNALRYQEVLKLKEMVEVENWELRRETNRISVDEIVGANFGLKNIMEMVRQVAPVDTPVLLLGESGVGKEVIANAVHEMSPRRNFAFIKVNCGAIPGDLLDSELFGHEKGAFTGAIESRRGFFERADKGSIFLDEIGELSPQAQVRLLRAIQNGEIQRVGGKNTIPVDVRVMSATHRNLEEMISFGHFREDLWYRINTFPIMIPPLRQRKEDIPPLIHHILEKKSKSLKIHTLPHIRSIDLENLKDYSWPGNIRELENLIERALIQSKGQNKSMPLRFDSFNSASNSPPRIKNEGATILSGDHRLLRLDEAMREHIKHALRLTNGKISGKKGAARILGINPNTLRSRMRKLGIPFAVDGFGDNQFSIR